MPTWNVYGLRHIPQRGWEGLASQRLNFKLFTTLELGSHLRYFINSEEDESPLMNAMKK